TGDRPPAPVALPGDDDASPPDRVVIPLSPLAPGVYVLRYRVLAVDGHITEGALRFTVGPPRQHGAAGGFSRRPPARLRDGGAGRSSRRARVHPAGAAAGPGRGR